MVGKTLSLLAVGMLCLCALFSTPAQAGGIAGLSFWYGGGDFTVYQAGGFIAVSQSRITSSVEFLGGTVDYGSGNETNRVDLNIATSMHLIRTRSWAFSPFVGYKMQSFETDIDFSGYGPSIGATLSLPSLSLSAAWVRTMGGEFDNQLIFVPTVSFRMRASEAPFGLMFGYRAEIFEDTSIHGGFIRAYAGG